MGADFRQALPVVPGREQTLQQCIINSHLWRHFHQFHLVTNMRAVQDETYRNLSDWLLRMDTYHEPHDEHDQVILLQEIVTDSLQDMTKCVYPQTQPGH